MKKVFLFLTFIMSLILSGCFGGMNWNRNTSHVSNTLGIPSQSGNEVDIKLESGNIEFGSGSKICTHVTLPEAHEISGQELIFGRGSLKVDNILTCSYVEKEDPYSGFGFGYGIETFKTDAEAKVEYDRVYKNAKTSSRNPSSLKDLTGIGEEGYFSTHNTPEKKSDLGTNYDIPAKSRSYALFHYKNYFINVSYTSPTEDPNNFEKVKKIASQVVEGL